MNEPHCRLCGSRLEQDFVDLGSTPLANCYLSAAEIARGADRAYPLHARVCASCFLVQVDAPVEPEAIFSDYAYFSSYSDSWVEHARRYALAMIARFGLGASSLVAQFHRAVAQGQERFCIRDREKFREHVRRPTIGHETAQNEQRFVSAPASPDQDKYHGERLTRNTAGSVGS